MKISALAALVCLALVASNARGELITFAFEGTVTNVHVFIGSQPESLPKVGDPFRGTYTFDSKTANSSSNPLVGRYTTRGAPSGVQVQVGQYELEGTGSAVRTAEAEEVPPPPIHDLYSTGNYLSNMELISHPELAAGLDHNSFELRIEGNTELLDGLQLPLTPPSLANATEAELRLTLDNSSNLGPTPYFLIRGRLESLTLVPEPSTALLAVLGLIGVFFAAERRRKRRES